MNDWSSRPTPPRSECAKTVARHSEEGNVLVLLLGAVVVLGLIGGTLLEIGNGARERALKLEDRDRAVGGIEFGLETLRHTVALELESQAWVDVGGLGSNPDQGTGALASAHYNIDLETQDGPEQIFATQLHNPLESLSAADDPFHGAGAVVTTFTVTANARSAISSSTDSRFNLPALQLTPQLSVRQIPVSEFTLFSSATSLALSQSGDTGRLHSEGDLIISGAVSSLYPVTASGNISLADQGSLVVQPADPGLAPLSFPVQSTTDDAWLAMARSTYRSTILSGRDLPMSMIQAAGISRLTGRTPGGATPITAQELWRQCSRVLQETNGKLALYDPAGVEVTGQEAEGFSGSGSQIIFDLEKEPPAPGRNSFYIESTNPNAVVVLVNGSSLPGDLSVISPHAITVEGGFNAQGRAVSLISGASVTAIPGSTNGTAGRQGKASGRGLWAGIARPITMSLARIGERALVLSGQAAAGFLQESLLGRFIPGGLERLWPAFPLSPQAQSSDGGGGGGSGDGGGGSGDGGGGSGDGGGGSGDGGNGNGNGGGSGGNSTDGGSTASTDGPSNSDGPSDAPADDPTTDPTNNNAPPTTDPANPALSIPNDPTEPTVTPEVVAIESLATTDPRGGAAPESAIDGGVPPGTTVGAGPGTGVPGAGVPAAPVDVAINAVIVSAANSPWGAVQRGSGVRNVIVTGGIIALGTTPLPAEPPPSSQQPAWLRVIPDPRLLDGSVIPPVAPNLIDIRWLNCPIKVVENPSN
jgi:hypothetical protein